MTAADSSSGAAPESNWAVEVDCPELTREERAEVEVRHLVELQALSGTPATLAIQCTPETVVGSWHQGGREISRRSISRSPNDKVLEVAHWLASMLIGVRQEQGPGATQATTVGTVTDDPLGASRASAGHDAGDPARYAEASEPPVPANPADSPAEQLPPATASAREARAAGHADAGETNAGAEEPEPATAASGTRWDVSGAVSVHAWGTELPLSLGPRLGGGLGLTPRWGARLAIGWQWGLGKASGFAVQEGDVTLQAQVSVWSWFDIVMGPTLSLASVRGSSAGTQKASESLTVGAQLLARFTGSKKLSPFAEIGVRGLALQREVTVDEQVVLTVPSWQAVLRVGLAWQH